MKMRSCLLWSLSQLMTTMNEDDTTGYVKYSINNECV